MVPPEKLWCSSYTYCICLRRKASRVHKNILVFKNIKFLRSRYQTDSSETAVFTHAAQGLVPGHWILVRILWKKVCSLSSKNHTHALFQGSKCSPLNFLSPASWKVILNYFQLFQKVWKPNVKLKKEENKNLLNADQGQVFYYFLEWSLWADSASLPNHEHILIWSINQ